MIPQEVMEVTAAAIEAAIEHHLMWFLIFVSIREILWRNYLGTYGRPIFDPLLSRFGGAPCGASLLGCCHAILRWPWNPLPDLRASFTFGRCSGWPGGPLL